MARIELCLWIKNEGSGGEYGLFGVSYGTDWEGGLCDVVLCATRYPACMLLGRRGQVY